MYDCCENPVHLCQFPTEILIYIFKFLSAKKLIICRQVCTRWKAVIDFMSGDDDMWERYCEDDYHELYIDVKKKSNSCRLWFDIYQSLTLWGRLSDATEVIEEFCQSASSADEIQDLVVLKNDIVSVHKRAAVVYYNLTTLQMTERDPVYGDFIRFIEYDDAIIILGSHLHLRIIKKPKRRRTRQRKFNSSGESELQQDEEKIFYNTKYFLTVGRDVYFVNFNNEIFHCNIDKSLVPTKLPQNYEDNVITLSFYNGQLNVLMQKCNVYSYQDNTFVKLFNLEAKKDNIFHCLWQYQFLETVNWRLFYMWITSLRIRIPEGQLKYICNIRVYGDTFFIGCKNGVLLIYHKPFTNGCLDFFSHEPIKEYSFADSRILPMLSLNPILTVDIVEIKGGHKMLVAMPKRVIVVTYNHSFGTTKSKPLQCVSDSAHV